MDRPAAVRQLRRPKILHRFPFALGIDAIKESAKHEIFGCERGIGFEFCNPIAFGCVLPGQKPRLTASNGVVDRVELTTYLSGRPPD